MDAKAPTLDPMQRLARGSSIGFGGIALTATVACCLSVYLAATGQAEYVAAVSILVYYVFPLAVALACLTALWLGPRPPLRILVLLVAATGASYTAELFLRLAPWAAQPLELMDSLGARSHKGTYARELSVELGTKTDSRSASEVLAVLTVPAERPSIDAERKDWAYFRRVLRVARRRVSGWGGRLLLAYVPDWERFAGRRLSSGAERRVEMLAIAAELGVPIIDIATFFQSHPPPASRLPFRQPGHNTQANHHLVADEVLRR